MVEARDKLTREQIGEICQAHFAEPVVRVTAPGGPTRDSLRVHFADHSIIATQRAYPGRMRLEVTVLACLNRAGAPVPRLLGTTERLFFQEDIGPVRLSTQLADANTPERADLAARAFASIVALQEAGAQTGLDRITPHLGKAEVWVAGLVSTPAATSEKYNVAPALLDTQRLVARLHVPARRFVKWDARPGNAALDRTGQVCWFDWEHCGRRQGMEDFAWLAGDEFFPLDAEAVLPILNDVLPTAGRARNIDYLIHFIVFHIAQRLTIIHREYAKDGWDDPRKAMAQDYIGADPDLAVSLCRHGAGWAGQAALTSPLVPWFLSLATAIRALPGPSK